MLDDEASSFIFENSFDFRKVSGVGSIGGDELSFNSDWFGGEFRIGGACCSHNRESCRDCGVSKDLHKVLSPDFCFLVVFFVDSDIKLI